jgi:hypothetical protein
MKPLPFSLFLLFSASLVQADEIVRLDSGVSGHIHPALCVTSKGTLIAVYCHAEYKPHRITRSTDGGKTWSKPALSRLLDSTCRRPARPCLERVVYRGAKGQVAPRLRATLRFLSLELSGIVQVKCFVHPMSKLDEVRKEMSAFFGKEAVPPLVFVQWQERSSIEIELIAAAPNPKVKPIDTVDYLTPPGMTASPIFSRVCRINHGKRIYVSALFGNGGMMLGLMGLPGGCAGAACLTGSTSSPPTTGSSSRRRRAGWMSGRGIGCRSRRTGPASFVWTARLDGARSGWSTPLAGS